MEKYNGKMIEIIFTETGWHSLLHRQPYDECVEDIKLN